MALAVKRWGLPYSPPPLEKPLPLLVLLLLVLLLLLLLWLCAVKLSPKWPGPS